MAQKVVRFTKDEIKKYLDHCITLWRERRDSSGSQAEMAVYYIDAYQSVRVSIYGELLEVNEDK